MTSGHRDEQIEGGSAGLSPQGRTQLAGTLADQFAVLYDFSPADPRVSLSGEMLTFAFQGGLSPSDEWLIQGGRGGELREFREHFLRVVGDQMSAVVEALTPYEVRRYLSVFDAEDRTTICFFVVAERSADAMERHRALFAWSEQVRRNARDLRGRHKKARETHVRLRDLLHDVRAAAADSDDD